MTLQEALRSAEAVGLDLVEVSPTAEPPVCRIMDFGKFVFEQNKKAQSARRKQKQIQVKEVKFRPGTEEGDYQIKLSNLIVPDRRGQGQGNAAVPWPRDGAHRHRRQFLNRLQNDLARHGSVEQQPLMEGRQMVMMIAPQKH